MACGLRIQKVASCQRKPSSFIYTRTHRRPNPARSRIGSRKRRMKITKMRPIGVQMRCWVPDPTTCRTSAGHYIKKVPAAVKRIRVPRQRFKFFNHKGHKGTQRSESVPGYPGPRIQGVVGFFEEFVLQLQANRGLFSGVLAGYRGHHDLPRGARYDQASGVAMKKLKFIFSLTNNDNDYQIEQAAAAEQAAKRLGVDVQIIQ